MGGCCLCVADVLLVCLFVGFGGCGWMWMWCVRSCTLLRVVAVRRGFGAAWGPLHTLLSSGLSFAPGYLPVSLSRRLSSSLLAPVLFLPVPRTRSIIVAPNVRGQACPSILQVFQCAVALPASCRSSATAAVDSCGNGVLDAPPETDVDCGGDGGCPRCSEAQDCAVDSDCASGLQCSAGGTCVGM